MWGDLPGTILLERLSYPLATSHANTDLAVAQDIIKSLEIP